MLKINGQWSKWSRWSGCSSECGRGNITRTRVCNSPKPKYNGTNCSTDMSGAIEARPCYRAKCSANISR